MGTPVFAVPALREVSRQCEVAAVVTQPDRPRGRGQHVSPSAVASAAEELNLEVIKMDRVNTTEARERLSALAPDLFAVVAFGAILKPEALKIPRRGCINLHGSLLPAYRGASPVQRALWDGCEGTGVTTMWMDEGVDTGDMILQRWEAIAPDDDAATLAARLAEIGAPLLAESLTLAHEGRASRRPQPKTGASYAPKLTKRDGIVEWALDSVAVWNRQRAVTPWPGAATMFRGRRLILLETKPHHQLDADAVPGTVLEVNDSGVVVACKPGAIRIIRVKPEGKTEMHAGEWARGAHIGAGDLLETEKEAHA